MDPYIDTIPDDHGEEIKKRVRERDDPDNEGRPTKRARANTSALLPPEGDRQDIEEPLKPEDDLDKYDHERLQQGLRYIDGAAKRKITPRTQEFLKLHKDAYKVALDGEVPDKASRAVVQAMDKVYFSAAFYLKPRSSEEHEHLMYYVKLRRLEFLANYGDYLGQELQIIRADLNAAAIGVDSEIQKAALELGPSKTWITIANELAGTDVADLRKHVTIACAVLGIDSEHMLWLIKEWAERNRVFRSQIRQYISDCHWNRLAEQICRDLTELLNVAPDKDTAAKYEKVLLSIQNEYFDAISRDDPQLWLLNEKSEKLTQEKLGREKKRAQK
ncbi:hypothetical protein HO133_009543 [Letharia lupina]|uniref:Uncharacterized protein n=1 Tax=Letharia lupina TaxID=560253 RepID=A0A8H6FF34_9LECA|nr:uncharacterized protein HO133_009543 [Letharia lupina]KAF6225543.1 hypothetical protein HO133_009543 [Letharia lupina]